MKNERMEKIQEKNTDDYINKLLVYLRQIINCEIQLLDVEKTKQKYLQTIENLNKKESSPSETAKNIMSIEKPTKPIKPVLKEDMSSFGFSDFLKNAGFFVGGLTLAWLVEAFIIPGSIILPFIIWGGVTTIPTIQKKLDLKNDKKLKTSKYNIDIDEYEQKMDEYQRQITDMENIITREQEEKAINENNIKNEKEAYEYKIEKLNELSIKIKNTLSILYEKNILHKKYQNLEAVLSIYEYLSTERTKSLGLINNDKGAYNLYEEEVLTRKDSKFVEQFVDSTNRNNGDNINNQQPFYYDSSSKIYQVLLSLASKLDRINTKEEVNALLQAIIQEQEKLQTVILNETPPIKK